jgi:hypothetical protein
MQKKTLWFISYIALLATSSPAQTNTFPTSGNVGIGTTSPVTLLHVRETTNQNILFNQDVNGGMLGAAGIVAVNDANSAYVPLGFYASQYYFGGGGNIGIGTATPSYKLDIATPAPTGIDTYSGLQIGASGTGYLYGYLLEGGLKQNFGAILKFSSNNNGAINERMRIDQAGNVGIGTTSPTSKLEVNGNVQLTNGSGASITFADGTTQSTAWTGTLCGGDYAETMDVSGERKSYEPGDVLMLDPNTPGNVLRVTEPYSTLVAGIYSMKPGVVGRRQIIDPKDSTTEVPMAMVGVVPTKVSAENGSIKIGDLLVTSSTPGHAMKGTDRTRLIGAIVGKAMGNLESGTGVIEVLVSLQ